MNMEAKAYDAEGKEIVLKEGHVLVIAPGFYTQVPVNEIVLREEFEDGKSK